MDEIARHVGLAFLCVAFAAGAAIVAFAGSLLRRAVGIALVGVSAAALVAALTSGVGGGERLARRDGFDKPLQKRTELVLEFRPALSSISATANAETGPASRLAVVAERLCIRSMKRERIRERRGFGFQKSQVVTAVSRILSQQLHRERTKPLLVSARKAAGKSGRVVQDSEKVAVHRHLDEEVSLPVLGQRQEMRQMKRGSRLFRDQRTQPLPQFVDRFGELVQ